MNYDRQITISAAGSRKAVSWPKQAMWWSEFAERLKTPARGTETLAAYLRMAKAQQDDLKDVGGFVGGIIDGPRKTANVMGRDLVTLDMDALPTGGTEELLRRVHGLGCSSAVYSTRKHEEGRPRLRVILPLDRTVSADEYEPAARKLAELIELSWCDPTTFQPSRLMYWPSCCADSRYVYVCSDQPFASADGILSMYADWRDVSSWPQVPHAPAPQKLAAKQGDPEAKAGIVGAFCRTYDVYRAMEELIPGIYEPCDGAGRYTYAGGSTTGGAVIYDNGKFLFSHHATDPSGGRLVNAFDLVRLHRFGDQDAEAAPGTPVNRLPSYTAMGQFAASLSEVTSLLNTERYQKAAEAFTGQSEGAESGSAEADSMEDMEWIRLLAVSSSTGLPAKTTDNALIILEHDPLLKGRLAYDEFAARGLVLGALPWDGRQERRQWTDVDDAGLRHYIEKVYQITGKERLYDAAALAAHKHTINDVKDYLTSLSWDSVPRLDTLLSDYLGADDTVYTRAVSRKSLTAAVARVMVPGVKYDYMPILDGLQGLGKSTFYAILGGRWYSDSLQTFEGKEASEMIQGTWINEIGELNGLSRSETNAVKQFLSRTTDIYREPYGRRTASFPRRCVFFGTTNDMEYLKDRTGNRRFWPVSVGLHPPVKSVFTDLPNERNQIWAEAFVRWQLGEPLYLTGEAERMAREQQEAHQESSAKEGMIREFAEREIPLDWEKRSLSDRRLYWGDTFSRDPGETTARTRICAAEVWSECFHNDIGRIRKSDAREINDILRSMPGWEPMKSSGRFGPYGTQRGYRRVSTLQ